MPLFKKTMGLFPKIDIDQITAQFQAKFDQLIGELRALGVKLDAILTAVQPKQ